MNAPVNVAANIVRWILSHILLISIFAIVIYLLIFNSELFLPRPTENTRSSQLPENQQILSKASDSSENKRDIAEELTTNETQARVNTRVETDNTETRIVNPDKVAIKVERSPGFIEPKKTQTVEESFIEFSSKVDTTIYPAVQPQIETAEQYELLLNARKALDSGDYVYAEALYVQLTEVLPELPDIYSELARVYKVQGKMDNYVITNVLLVKKLVYHNRFDEAWNVVKATSKINNDAALKQINIIEARINELTPSVYGN